MNDMKRNMSCDSINEIDSRSMQNNDMEVDDVKASRANINPLLDENVESEEDLVLVKTSHQRRPTFEKCQG